MKIKNLFYLLLIPAVISLLGYSMGFPMLNMWDLFVENIFGTFWLAVICIMLIFFLILMLGGVSFFTVQLFLLFFILAMAIGYGQPLITVTVVIFGTMYCIYQTFKFLENR